MDINVDINVIKLEKKVSILEIKNDFQLNIYKVLYFSKIANIILKNIL